MKTNVFLLFIAVFVLSFTLEAGKSIRLSFQPDFPIDSIRVENLDNLSSQTFTGQDILFLGIPSGVDQIATAEEKISIKLNPESGMVQFSFHQKVPGFLNCEIFNLQGHRVAHYYANLGAEMHQFSFVPQVKGIYFVRMTTVSSTQTAKFISFASSGIPRLAYESSGTSANSENKPSFAKLSTDAFGELIVKQNDLLRIACFSGSKVQTIYDYANSDKNYVLRFTERYHQFQLYNIVASKPSFVDVMYAVTDASNRGVDDLSNPDFVVREDDSPVSASESFRDVQKVNQIPFEIKTVLMIDNSISIVNDLEIIKMAALQYVRKVRPKQKIAVYVFSDVPTLLQDFTSDTTLLQTAIDKITLGYPSTNLYGSVITGLSRWTDQFTLSQLTQGSLIVFTDGNDTQGSSTLTNVIAARGTKKVYMIGLGSEITPSVLNQISYPSGFISIQKAGELEETFNQIQADIVRYSNSFYWLNYMSPKRTGTRTLAVSTAGNTNLSANAQASGSFSANGFESVNSGVYVNINNAQLYGIDSVYCFYKGNAYNFTTTRYGAVAGKDSLVLKPVTYWAFKQPFYNWTLDKGTHFSLTASSYSSTVLKATANDTIGTSITVQDQANKYSKQVQVKMLPEEHLFKDVTSSDITGTTAFVSSAVIWGGRLRVLSKGFIWSVNPNPTIALTTKTNHGTGEGSFATTITGLKTGTMYYVRAYATNSVETNYGNQETFTTSLGLPELTTTAISSITSSTAVCGGTITHDGGATITERGVCWSTSPTPTINDSISKDGTGSGSYTSSISGLKSGTTYYVRAYATNIVGSAYGNEVVFKIQIIEVGDVLNPVTAKVWMDRNLGASSVAISSANNQAYGDLYQWGRGTDGHEKRTSTTTTTLTNSDSPGHGRFITLNSSPYDWRSPQNNNLWQGVNGVNNPCPEGYRLPSSTEWDAERASWSSKNSAGAFASPLKLPAAGYRGYVSYGSLDNVGSVGFYWSNTVSGTNAQNLSFYSSNASMNSSYRAYGGSVRCIKE